RSASPPADLTYIRNGRGRRGAGGRGDARSGSGSGRGSRGGASAPALGVRVRVRRLHRRVDDLDRFAAEDVVEAAAELAVAIVDQEADRLLAVAERHQQVAGLLGYPGTVGRAG